MPYFGYVDANGNPIIGTTNPGSTPNNYIWACKYNVNEPNVSTVIVTSLSQHLRQQTNPYGKNIRLALYTDNGSGRPAALLAQTGDIPVPDLTGAGAWVTGTITSVEIPNPGTYWIAVQVQYVGGTYPLLAYSGDTQTDFYEMVWYSPSIYGTLPDPFPNITGNSNRIASLYATYVAGAPIPVPWHVTVLVDPVDGGHTVPNENATYDVDSGTEFPATATPNENWIFEGWGLDGVPITMPIPAQPDGTSHTLVAHFTYVPPPPKPWSITISVDPAGVGYTNPEIGTYPVNSGETFTATATPYNPADYAFDWWELDNSGTPISMPIPAQPDTTSHTLIAHFRYIGTTPVTVNFSSDPQGVPYIQPSGTAPFSQTVPQGSDLTVEVPASIRVGTLIYDFSHLTDGTSQYPNPYTFTNVQSAFTVIAVYTVAPPPPEQPPIGKNWAGEGDAYYIPGDGGLGGFNLTAENKGYCKAYTLGTTITALVARIRTLWLSAQPYVRGAIYDSGGNLLAVTEEHLLTNNAYDWMIFYLERDANQNPISSLTLAEGTYWLTLIVGAHADYSGVAGSPGYGDIVVCGESQATILWGYKKHDAYATAPSLIWGDNTGAVDMWKQLDIYGTNFSAAAPTAKFSVETPLPRPDTDVYFRSNSIPGYTGSEESPISNYVWDFGDGSPTASGANLVQTVHRYARTGKYTVTLTVTDSQIQPRTSVPTTHSVNVVSGAADYRIDVGFEDPDDTVFALPLPWHQGDRQVYPLQSEGSYANSNNAEIRVRAIGKDFPVAGLVNPFKPDDAFARCLEIALLAPEPILWASDDTRCHMVHLWNPMEHKDIWAECKYLIPADFRWVENQWLGIMDPLEEGVMDFAGGQASQIAFEFSLINDEDGRLPDGTFKMQITDEGVNTPISVQDKSIKHFWRTSIGFPVGRPFALRFHAYRPIDVDDPVASDAGGYIELWYNDYTIEDKWVALDWHLHQTFDNGSTTWSSIIDEPAGTRLACRTVAWNPYIEIYRCEAPATYAPIGTAIVGQGKSLVGTTTCGYLYDYIHYAKQNNLPERTFAQLESTWVCPNCGATHDATTWKRFPPMQPSDFETEMPMTVAPHNTEEEKAKWWNEYGLTRAYLGSSITDFYTGVNTRPDPGVLKNVMYYDDLVLSTTPIGQGGGDGRNIAIAGIGIAGLLLGGILLFGGKRKKKKKRK